MAGVSQPIRRGNGYRPRVRSRRSSVGKRLGGGSAVPPLQRSANRKRGSNWERTAQEAEEEVPAVSAGRFGNAGPAQELQEAFLGRRPRAFPNHRNIGLEARNGILRGIAEEPDLPAESPESSGQGALEAVCLSPEETQVPFQTENAWEPEPSARRMLTAGKARSRWQSGRLPNRMIRARRFPGASPRRLRLCGIPAGRRLTIRRRRIILWARPISGEAGISSGIPLASYGGTPLSGA